jgi:UDP-N-acetylglucosamine 2-epimerase (non-hydrolysing)
VKISIILGTRPEIIKMAPVIRELEKRNRDYFILHTGQHYSYNLDRVFFERLRLPSANYNLEVGSRSSGEQIARILTGSEKVLVEEKPDVVLVEGDTNSVLAGALAAVTLHIKLGHVEAGLRSYDRSMPEEINRILADHCADFLFAPTEKAKAILLGEGLPDARIFVTGNTIVDAVHQNLQIAREKENIVRKLGLKPRQYFLVTLHRPGNVDHPARFGSIIDGLNKIGAELGSPVVYPIHPRSRKMMTEFNLEPKNIKLIEPVDFLEFLQLESNARLVLTDSGGVQEESCILGVPCVTLRDNTERPETIEVGANILAGASPDKILECSREMLRRKNSWENPFGDGKAAVKIIDLIEKEEN